MGKKRDKKEEEEEKEKGRSMACCEKEGVRRGAWTAEEDKILVDFITQNGHGTWRNLPKLAGLLRFGKSCRLRWTNYLRPDIKRGPFSPDEENAIIRLHSTLGNKWAAIASHLPGRTDNDIKNFWNSHLRKRFKVPSQTSSSSKSVDTKCDSIESVGIPAESSHLSDSKSEGDYFLLLWNSEVGESFRNINENTNGWDSSASQTSSSTKVESADEQKMEILNCKKEAEESLEMDEDSSDAMLKLLLDFPVEGDDMESLQGPLDDIPTQIS